MLIKNKNNRNISSSKTLRRVKGKKKEARKKILLLTQQRRPRFQESPPTPTLPRIDRENIREIRQTTDE